MDNTSNLIETLKQDYQRFPSDQTYELYAADVYFKDPLSEFRGIQRYRQMIGFIATWFANPRLDLHHIQQENNLITTRWTLSWNSPLPWKPRIHISGWSELHLNADGLISTHIDYWHCSTIDVLKQHFVFRTALQ